MAARVDAPATVRTRTIRVRRTARAGVEAAWSRFEVPVTTGRMTVLDALTWARTHLDPTLDVRHGCFHASCGTCGMRVDGREVLACVARLDDLRDGEVVVEPLRNQDVISDLVVDLEALYAAFDAVARPLVRDAGPADAVEGSPAARFEDCLECGLCVSACPVAACDPTFPGPGILAAVERIVEEPRGVDVDAALALVHGDQGAWRCHVAFECSAVCPSDARPAEHVMRLRRGLLRARIGRHGKSAASIGRHA
jgi:succinate dehydrogenase / fumarate reductase iron-sulfur subunit